MNTTTKQHYRVITPDTFSDIDTVCTEGKLVERSRKLIETIDEALLAISHFGSSESPEYAEYWKQKSSECKIVHVITIIEDINLDAIKAIKAIESNFNELQVRIIKATISCGFWGSADFELNNNNTVGGMGYMTRAAKDKINDLTPSQIAGYYSGIAKVIKENDFDFINHIPDYWGEGRKSDGMLFIDGNISDELEKWSKA